MAEPQKITRLNALRVGIETGEIQREAEERLVFLSTDTRTLTGSVTLTISSLEGNLLLFDPGGSGRNIDLPPEADSTGLMLMIANTADAAESLVIREDSGSTTIVTISQNESGIVWCDGTSWKGLVGANT